MYEARRDRENVSWLILSILQTVASCETSSRSEATGLIRGDTGRERGRNARQVRGAYFNNTTMRA